MPQVRTPFRSVRIHHYNHLFCEQVRAGHHGRLHDTFRSAEAPFRSRPFSPMTAHALPTPAVVGNAAGGEQVEQHCAVAGQQL